MRARTAARSLLALLLVPAVAAVGQSDPAGRWTGSMEPADGEPIELTVVLGRTGDGGWSGTLLAPSVQAESMPLEAVTSSGGEVRFRAAGLPGAPEFVGRLSAGGSEITGSVYAPPPPGPPATDLYLMDVRMDEPTWQLGPPVNITDRDGYDNQPRFLPDGSGILYTSIRDGQADVYRYEIGLGRSTRLTQTSESEYSPTPLPSGDGFSTVRVEEDGTQRLWSFDPQGDEPRLVLEEVAPVGYHAWLDDHRLALFVLGEPPTLQLADADRQSSRIVASSIGRAIHPTPDGAAVSFVHKAGEGDWRIDALDHESGTRRTLVAIRGAGEDFIWLPDGRLLMADGGALLVGSPGVEPTAWRQAADLGPFGVAGITRLDVSADGRRLVVVGERAAPAPPAPPVGRPFALRRSG